MIVGWIRTSVDPKVRSTVTFVADAHKLWETLTARFSVKNSARIHQIQDAITNCRQDGQSVLDYYGRLTKLWEEMQNLRTSRPCTCDDAADIEKEREDARVHKFLFCLDDSRFLSIRSRITDEDPLPDLNSVYSQVIREEQNMVNSHAKEQHSEALGFSVKTEPSRQRKLLHQLLLLVLEIPPDRVLTVDAKDMKSQSVFWFMAFQIGIRNNVKTATINLVTLLRTHVEVWVLVLTPTEDEEEDVLMRLKSLILLTQIRLLL